MSMVLSDEQLMQEMAGGSRGAFELIVQRWDRRMVNFFLRCASSREEAEDLRQELFLRIYLRAETFKPDGCFQAWIYRIASNLIIDKVGRRKTMRPDQREDLDENTPSVAYNQARESVKSGELKDYIRQALDSIPSDQRMALVMRHYEGLRFEEIARILEVSESTLKSRVYRGLLAMKEELQKLGIFEMDCFQEV